MMDKREEQLALELDAFLTARQKGQPTPLISAELAAECQLADDLLNLANDTEMNHSFLSDLEAQLMAAASAASRSPQNKLTPPRTAVSKRPSFWGELIKQIEELFTMKKITYAVGAVMAMLMIGFVVWSVWPGGDEPTAVADLPALPGIGGGAREMGGGGYGGGGYGGDVEIAEDAILVEPGMEGGVDIGMGMPMWDPFAEAEFTLNVDLANESGQRPVYSMVLGGLFNLEEANRFASLFGFTGGAYIEKYPDFYDSDWTPPTSYQFFDGRRQLSVTDAHFYYMDNSVTIERESDYMPFNQAAPIAEAFLRERGLLNFPYEMAAPPYSQYAVEFRRVVDGVVMNQPEYQLNIVAATGQIVSLSHTPYGGMALLGDYPIRSAAEAWQTFVNEGVDYRRINFSVMPGPNFVMPEYPEPDVDFAERYRYWERSYQDGEMVQAQPYVMAFLPAFDGGLPRVQIDRYQLIADADSLWAISEQVGKTIYLRGVYRQLENGPALELVEWRPQDEPNYFFTIGLVERSGENTFVAGEEGETFYIPNAPAELQDGERIYVSGVVMDETVDGRRVVEWQGMGRSPEEEMMAEDSWMPVEPTEDYIIRQVNISRYDLVYTVAYVYEDYTQPPTLVIQPVWRFSGEANNGELVEIYIQAVADEFIEQE
jgi:hypothetical protein